MLVLCFGVGVGRVLVLTLVVDGVGDVLSRGAIVNRTYGIH